MNAANKKATNTTEVQKGNGAVAGLLIFSILIMIANFGYNLFQSPIDDKRINDAEELRVLSQQISNNATESVGGNVDAFKFLGITRNSYENTFNSLKGSLLEADFKLTSPEGVRRAIRDATEVWEEVRDNTDTILKYRNTVLDLHDVALKLSQTIPELQSNYQEVVRLMVANNLNNGQVSIAANQVWLAERILGSVQKILAGEVDSVMATESFRQDILTFGQITNGFIEGNSQAGVRRIGVTRIRNILTEISKVFSGMESQSTRIIESITELSRAHQASDKIFADAADLLAAGESLSIAFTQSSNSRLPGNPMLSGALILVVMFLLGIMYMQQRRRERQQIVLSEDLAKKEKEQNERNQEAIIRLLDEMEGLADGDLTSHATVTEDFTGAIADAMNYTIDQLRNLVSAINRTVDQVGQSTDQTRATAAELAQASRNQAQEIAGASGSISDMAQSIEAVSKNATETTEMAQESV
ncbi:MAG: chemotaxis protein, partial [Enterobacterales bacterium]|nr:chemotaxis protein [Enterobacterales bacterium]